MSSNWYALQVYSGHELKVQRRLELLQEAEGKNFILDIRSPKEEHVEMRQGKKRKVEKQLLPGYMFVELELDDLNWREQCSRIRTLQGVVGFVGTTAREKPQPVPSDDVKSMLQKSGDLTVGKAYTLQYSFSEGENLKIINGPFEGFVGEVEAVYADKGKLRMTVGIFGRPTPVELDFSQVERHG